MLKKNTASLLAVLLVLTLAFVFGGCQKRSTDTASETSTVKSEETKELTKLEQIKKAGKIILGTSADYPPYEFHKAVNGKDEIVGFDIEIAKEIAKDLGVELQIQDMEFDGLLSALNAGNIDFVISGMTPTDERKQSVDFTKIYYTAQQGVMVRSEDKDKIKTVDDLKGKKVGAQKGSIQETIANEQLTEVSVVALTKIPDLVMELKTKKVDAIVVELPVANGYVGKHKDLAISEVQVKDDTGGSAAAIKKGNTDLVDAINKTIDRLIADKTLDRLVAEANEMVESE